MTNLNLMKMRHQLYRNYPDFEEFEIDFETLVNLNGDAENVVNTHAAILSAKMSKKYGEAYSGLTMFMHENFDTNGKRIRLEANTFKSRRRGR